MSRPCYFHVDMDAFYASIEQRDNPKLRGFPVVVGGHSNRGVVAACSYEARRYGIHSAMPIKQALRLCPDACIVPVRMHHYVEVSRSIMRLLRDYSPTVQAISIDEAYLDMTGTERLLGTHTSVASRIKQEIREVTDLTISVGIGTSRFIAKLASEVDKPDGLHEVLAGTEADFVLGLELRSLWGLGARTLQRLERLGITTVEELRSKRIEYLRGHFGESAGAYLHSIARGTDPGIYDGKGSRHSISAEQTFETDTGDVEELRAVIRDMADEVIHRSIQENWRGRTIQVKYRFPPFETHTISRTLPRPVESSDEFAQIAADMLESRRGGRSLRLLGIGIGGDIHEHDSGQGELFAGGDERHTAKPIDPTIVALHQRFGRSSITRASRIVRSEPGE